MESMKISEVIAKLQGELDSLGDVEMSYSEFGDEQDFSLNGNEYSLRGVEDFNLPDGDIMHVHITFEDRWADVEIDNKLMGLFEKKDLTKFISWEIAPYIEAMLSLKLKQIT